MPVEPLAEEDIFNVARKIDLPEARAAYLQQVCGNDDALRGRIEALLLIHEQAKSFLPTPLPAATCADVLAERSGAVIGAYKLLDPIGEGGMGTVWLAQQTEPVKRMVALKLIKAGMDTKQVIARFEAERQALALMDHPNIARVLDAGTTSAGRPYFVMDLVKGVPITSYCDEHHLTPRQRLELLVPVCHAVQHAHQKGIIHRDIKPSNVLVALYDGKPVPKVIDFGVAKALGQELTDKTLFTGIAQMVGTPLYMSPEQAGQCSQDIDTRSDIYSLGVLLYELLTGTTPFLKDRFKQAAHDEIRRIIREEDPPKPSTRLSESKDSLPSISAQRQTEPAKLSRLVRGDLDWIVMKALDKDRNRRYETANGFAMDLQRYLADEPVAAGPPSLAYRMRKFVRRNKGPVLAAALILLALVAGIIGTTWGMIRANEAKGEAEEVSGEKDNALKARDQAIGTLRRNERQAKIDLSQFQLDKGLQLCEMEQVDLGLLWLARALESVPADAEDLARVIRINLASWAQQVCRLKTMVKLPGSAQFTAYSPDGKSLLCICGIGKGENEVTVLDSATGMPQGKPLTLSPAHKARGVFAPDGWVVAAITDEGKSTQLWHVASRRPLGPPQVHSESIHNHDIRFSADGKTMLTQSANAVWLWDTATGKAIGKSLEHRKMRSVNSAYLSADGAAVVTASGDARDQTVLLWNTVKGESTPLPIAGQFKHAAFTPDNRFVLTMYHAPTKGEQPRQLGQFWDAASGKPAGAPMAQNSVSVYPSCLFSPDGRLLAISPSPRIWLASSSRKIGFGSSAKEAKGPVFNLRWGERQVPLLPKDGNALAFSPDGLTLTTMGSVADDFPAIRRAQLRFWTTHGQTQIGAPLHASQHHAPAFSPDGRTFALRTSEGAVGIWEMTSGSLPLWATETVRDLATDADGGDLLWWGPDSVPFRRSGSISSFGTMSALSFAADGRSVISAARGSSLSDVIYLARQDVASGKLTPAPTFPVTAVPEALLHVRGGAGARFSRDGKVAVTLSLRMRSEPIGPNRSQLFADESTVKVWDTATWKAIGIAHTQKEERIWSIMASPDARHVLLRQGKEKMPFDDFNYQLFETVTWRAVAPAWTAERVSPRALSPNGKRLLVSDGNEGQWRDAATGVRLPLPSLIHQGNISAVSFSADGRLLVTGSEDHTARIWDVATGSLQHQPLRHQARVTAVAFSPDGTTLLTGSSDYTARLWDVATGKPLGPFLRHAPKPLGDSSMAPGIRHVAFSPDGRRVVTATDEGHVRCWEVPATPPQSQSERLVWWARTITDRDVDAGGIVGWQKAETWNRSRQRLQDLGGAPVAAEDTLSWHRRRAALAMRDWHYFAARWHLDRLIAAEPKEAAHYVTRGRASTQLGQHEEAIADLTKALALGTKQPEAWQYRAKAHAALKQWDQASADYAVIAVRGHGVAAWCHIATEQLKEGNLDVYQRFCAAIMDRLGDTDNASIAGQVARTCALGPSSGIDPARLVSLAEKALAEVVKARPSWPSTDTAKEMLALTLYRAGRFEAASQRLHEVGTLSQFGLFLQAMAHKRMGQTDAAQWLDKAIAASKQQDEGSWAMLQREASTLFGVKLAGKSDTASPDKTDETPLWKYYFDRGQTQAKLKQHDKAVADYARALEHKGDEALIRLKRGIAYFALRQWSDAQADLSKVIDLKKDDAEAWYWRGRVHDELNEPAKAIADLSTALELDKKLPDAAFHRGQVHMKLRHWDEAIADFSNVSGKDRGQAIFNRGRCYASLNRLDEAIADYKQTVKLLRNYAFAHYLLGSAFSRKGDLDGAIAAYKGAIRINPNYAEAHCDLGSALQRKGQFVEALAARKKGHELGSKLPGWPYPSEKWVKQCERLVELDSRVPAILKGESKPKDVNEHIEFTQLCTMKKHHAAAAKLYREILTAKPGFVSRRYSAARAAALAGTGQGEDAAKVNDEQRADWRKQAHTWLQADLDMLRKQAQSDTASVRAAAQKQLESWKSEPDFAGVRTAAALLKLPDAERQEWQQLWADVEKIVQRAKQKDK